MTDPTRRYDKALAKSTKMYPPPEGIPLPQPTSAWPPENVDLLHCYTRWLHEGGLSRNCIEQIYIPMAGHILGLSLKPYPAFDPDTACNRGIAYIEARQMSDAWTRNCRRAADRFRRFLQTVSGDSQPSTPRSYNSDRYLVRLPDWMKTELNQLRIRQQANWRKSQIRQRLPNFWRTHTALWRWLFEQAILPQNGGPACVTALRRQHVHAYIDKRLDDRMGAKTINVEIRAFQSTLRSMRELIEEEGGRFPAAMLSLRGLTEKDHLPRFLTDAEVETLRRYYEERIETVQSPMKSRDAYLDRAMFTLMWQAGLRLGEVCEVQIDDLRLQQRQLTVRAGKGLSDRVVYLTDPLIRALNGYLPLRGRAIQGHEAYLFLYRFKQVDVRMVGKRVLKAGQAVGVKVSPHRLRHTFGTQLVNAGCPITSIQRLMGHKRITSTMVYARVHDRTVADDYFRAMAQIEGKLGPSEGPLTADGAREGLETLLKRMQEVETEQSRERLLERFSDHRQALLELLQRWPIPER